uniref:Uncharacterized protein n=1 Tax=Polysiphonia sp. TaxID=1967842 RepID=A0A1Z1M478_9FLOR|nr:hypothetical protein [Polysiphonia sp.]
MPNRTFKLPDIKKIIYLIDQTILLKTGKENKFFIESNT